jgi:two-component system, OmpR family, response regulator
MAMAQKKILLIETDDDVRNIVTIILEDEGFEVITADPHPAALMANTTSHLILLDEWINTNGSDMLCREIKAIHELKHIPVVILSTAINIREIVESCKADGFVRKPFVVKELVDEINRCLDTGLGKASLN